MWLALLTVLMAYDAQYEAARAREEAQDDAGAIAIWEAAVAQDPRAALPRVELARLLLKSGQQLDAVATHLQTAATLAPSNPRTHYLLALLAEEQRDSVAARRSLETALALRADYDDARYRLAGLLMAEGNFTGAVDAYRELVSRHPDDGGLRLQLAVALERGGRVGEAERLLRALEKDPTTGRLARRRLAELLDRRGHGAEAARLRAKESPPSRRLRELRPSSR
jgi:Flp pilus assembly protein TadD